MNLRDTRRCTKNSAIVSLCLQLILVILNYSRATVADIILKRAIASELISSTRKSYDCEHNTKYKR